MNFLSPWWLTALPVIAAVAILTLRRPDRRLMIVSTVKFWSAAKKQAGTAKVPARRISIRWIFLLLGALAGLFALAQPIWISAQPARYVRLELAPSAEVASPEGIETLRNAGRNILAGLNDNDRVQIVLPISAGGDHGWCTKSEAMDKLDKITPLPIPADDLNFPPATEKVQHTFRIAPTPAAENGPDFTQIAIPSCLPEITFDAIAGKPQPDGMVQIFAALRNNSENEWPGEVEIQPVGQPGKETSSISVRIAPKQTASLIQNMSPAEAYRIVAGESVAWLARENAGTVKVAILGPDQPTLRRYIQADPSTELWATPEEVDVVIANGLAPPAETPALIINPPKAPPGWQEGEPMQNVVLNSADIVADDAILRDVSVAGLAVRRAKPWRADKNSNSPGVPIVSVSGQTMILRTAPERSALPTTRLVYMAFAPSAGNTNIESDVNFVILLANIFRWLGEKDYLDKKLTYSYKEPRQTFSETGLTIVDSPSGRGNSGKVNLAKFCWPGLYCDQSRAMLAVNLTGLKSVSPAENPEKAIRNAALPMPVESEAVWPIWPVLIILMVVLWLAGWALRV